MLEKLYAQAEKEGLKIVEHRFKSGSRLKAILIDDTITFNESAQMGCKEKTCVLAEELGHHYKTHGNILDQSKIVNRQLEKRARNWSYERLLPLNKFIRAYKAGIRNRYEFAEMLGVTEEFLEQAIKHYNEQYGVYVPYGIYYICFDPVGVIERFDL